MKVLNARDSFLTNHEVLEHLNDMKVRYAKESEASGGTNSMKAGNLETVLMEVKDYLSQTPAATQTDASIEEFMERMAPYKLEKIEILMIINARPLSYPELDVLVEELETRLTEDQVEDILATVRDCFGAPEEPEDQMDEAEG